MSSIMNAATGHRQRKFGALPPSPVGAFTLIEILIVLAVIAILAAVLIPLLIGARQKSQTASCASNMRQIALAVLMYTQDYDEHHPTRTFTSVRTGQIQVTNVAWAGQIMGYVKSTTTFQCPTDTTPRHQTGANYMTANAHAVFLNPDLVSAGGTALASTNLEATSGCHSWRPDIYSVYYECAAGTEDATHQLTFSVR